jgi:hypothetical protein
MKLLLAFCCLEVISLSSAQPAAPAKPTCEDCHSLVSAISAFSTSQEGIARQVDVLLSKVCPKSSNPEECLEGLPAFWTEIAQGLWPEYYNPEAEWMCGQKDVCGGPDAR